MSVQLFVPVGREACQSWIGAQPPHVVADCLDICQAAFHALQREIGEGEASRMASEIAKLRAESLAKSQEQEDLWRQRLAEQQHLAEEANNLLRSELTALRSTSAEEALRQEEAWRQRLRQHQENSLERERLAEAAAQKSRDELLQKIIQEYQVVLEEQEAKTSRLRKELESYDERNKLIQAELKERFLEEKELLKAQLMQQMSSLSKEHQQQLELHVQKLEQQAALGQRLSIDLEAKQRENQELLNRLQAETRRLYEEKAADANRFYAEKESILSQYQDFLRSCAATASSDNTAVGKMGEDFVSAVHASMDLGSWEDTSKRPEEGCADAVWTLDFPSSRKMRALVEIKNVATLHSVKDLQKFENDVSQAAKLGSINAAVLVSLRARVPGKKQMDISLRQGIVVAYLSRAADDPLPAETLVRLGFYSMASIWPLLQFHRGDSDQHSSALQNASAFLDEQLLKAQKLSKSIDDLEKQCRNLRRVSVDLKKTRDSMVNGVECLRTQFPQLQPECEEPDKGLADPWISPGAQELLRLVVAWKDAHGGRYPKSWADLGALPESVKSFFLETTSDLSFRAEVLPRAKACVPKGAPKGQKRARTETAEAGPLSAREEESCASFRE